MSEQMEKIVNVLEQNLRIVAFAVAIALLGGVWYVANSGSTTVTPPVEEEVVGGGGGIPGGVAVVDSPVAAIRADLRLDQRTTPLERSEFKGLYARSMFDHSSVDIEKQMEAQALQLAQQAQKYYTGGNYVEAVKYCKQALQKHPNNMVALALKKKLTSVGSWR